MNSKPPRERESKIQRSIVTRLARLGISLERHNVGAREWTDKSGRERLVPFGKPGQSDLYGMDWPTMQPWGRHWEIETKRPGKRPTVLQLTWLKLCHSRGAVAFWADSANVAEQVAEAILAGGRIVWRTEPGYHPDGADFDVDMEMECENCGAVIPSGLGGFDSKGRFICCPACMFNPLGCRCKYGEHGIPECIESKIMKYPVQS